MLIEFEVENFLSFNNRAVLSLEKGKYLKKHSNSHVFTKSGIALLKNVNVFGPNGSGKSNLISALKHFANLVLEPTEDIEERLSYYPFKLDDDSSEKDTTFSVKFIKEGTVYRYTLKYNAEEVLLEELSIIAASGTEVIYFRRTTHEDNNILPNHLNDLMTTVRKNKLLLFEGQDKNDQTCVSVFQWFHSSLVFEPTGKNLFDVIQKDKRKKELFIKLLNLADFNIADIEMIPTEESIPKGLQKFLDSLSEEARISIKNRKAWEIYSIYKKYDKMGRVIGTEKISYNLESAGTRKMMLVALTILNSMHKECVVIMDEFDQSFHLSLSKALLDIINSSANHNQFIFTTHNLNLLDSNLRVDQIYLVEKDFLGRTDLFSLFDFNEIKGVARSDMAFVRRYLDGQFGALPDIDLEGMKSLFLGGNNG